MWQFKNVRTYSHFLRQAVFKKPGRYYTYLKNSPAWFRIGDKKYLIGWKRIFLGHLWERACNSRSSREKTKRLKFTWWNVKKEWEEGKPLISWNFRFRSKPVQPRQGQKIPIFFKNGKQHTKIYLWKPQVEPNSALVFTLKPCCFKCHMFEIRKKYLQHNKQKKR